jgi:hypothetical protein
MHVTRHTSHVTRHTSHVTRHTSPEGIQARHLEAPSTGIKKNSDLRVDDVGGNGSSRRRGRALLRDFGAPFFFHAAASAQSGELLVGLSRLLLLFLQRDGTDVAG